MAPIDDPVFNINFVRIVGKYPCLWDQNTVEYSQRDLTEKAWKAISKEVNDTAANCRERWRNIRGSFLRSLKKSRKGGPRKKYYLSEYLEFLRPYVKYKKASDNEDSDTQETATDNQSNSIDNQFEEFDDSKSQVFREAELMDPVAQNMMLSEDFFDPYDTKPSSSKKRRTECSDVSDTFAECIKNMVEKNNVERDDPNMLFLRSLLPDMMKMTDKQNRKFRLKVLGLIDGILEENEAKSLELPSHSSN